MNWIKKEWLQIVILALPFCVAALVWNQLPDRMPSHWDLHWQVDGYANKVVGALVLPLANIGMALLGFFAPLLDSKMRSYNEETRSSVERVMRIIRLAGTAFFSCISLALLAVGLNKSVNMFLVAQIGIGLLFVVIGNVMPKLRPNRFVGVRTRRTLESPEIWRKANRLGGQLFVAAGFLLIIFAFVVPSTYYFLCVFLPLLIAIAVITLIYSCLVQPGPN